jgi:hypothetical protein
MEVTYAVIAERDLGDGLSDVYVVMLADQLCKVLSVRIRIHGANTGDHETVSPAIPAFVFLSAAHVIAVHRSDRVAPSPNLLAQCYSTGLNCP